ncbi:hypothetical protein [Methylobacterium indicum]|uniref:Uncharacterized protein n=1 Tax=Methylobacterium indicum TaxID=1775910 RepID=A0A8H8X055_9HYPH|nr:hypothetical protein [Methylobacterium indicum]BCM87776.1 hypothetical protein mvi_62370 [Methylobacterium indicum]
MNDIIQPWERAHHDERSQRFTLEEIPKGQLIGYSLSFCVRDMLDGMVGIERIEHIITGTMARSPEEWQAVINEYARTYWRRAPSIGKSLAQDLWLQGKIQQPRVYGMPPPRSWQKHWGPAATAI